MERPRDPWDGLREHNFAAAVDHDSTPVPRHIVARLLCRTGARQVLARFATTADAEAARASLTPVSDAEAFVVYTI